MAALVRHRLAPPAPPRRRPRRRRRPPRAPRPRRDLRALRGRPPGPRSSAATPACVSFLEIAARPADPGRHPRRARRARRGRAAAHRPPVQGPRVAARRGRARPGGGLARPAPPVDAAAGRPDRRRRARCRPPTRVRRCWPRSAGCSTSPAPAPASGCVVTAVASPEDDGEQPSRFVDELGATGRRHVARAARQRPLSLGRAGRASCAAPPPTPPPPRPCATRRRAGSPGWRAATHRGQPLGAAGRPGHLVGHPGREPAPISRSAPPTSRCTLSASSLDALLTCPAQWFLEREAGGDEPSSQSQGFGLVVHAIADRIAKGELRRRSASELSTS